MAFVFYYRTRCYVHCKLGQTETWWCLDVEEHELCEPQRMLVRAKSVLACLGGGFNS